MTNFMYFLSTIIGTMSIVQGIMISTGDLQSSIDKIQQKFTKPKSTENSNSKSNQDQDLKSESTYRQDKMLDFFGYYPPPMVAAPQPIFVPHEFYSDYNHIFPMDDTEEEIDSRANQHRRPGNSAGRHEYQDSPIYYIRLPPTPYMFVPGMGYLSQPPTIKPLAPIVPVAPTIAPLHLPLNFISNGRPSYIYQYENEIRPQYSNPYYSRPQRQPYRPKPYLPDTKITNLKGPYTFNGRPNNIYLMQNQMYNHVNPYY